MGRALSHDLRMRILKATAGGMSARQAAARFGIGISTAIRWVARARSGELEARSVGRWRGSRLDAHEAFISAMIEAQKDITLDEMVDRLLAKRGARIGRSALSNWLRRQSYTFKKRPHTHWSRCGRTC